MAMNERQTREFLADWRLWMVIAYLGLVSVIVALFVLFGRTAHEEAARAAAASAAAVTQVGQCFTAVKNGPVTKGFIDAHEAVIDNSLIANRAALAASPKDDPLRQIRVRSIIRLQAAQNNVKELRSLIAASTPTEKRCVHLARMLRVDPTRYLKTLPN